MYNLTTQVQVLTDIDLGSYYLKNLGASPTIFLSKKYPPCYKGFPYLPRAWLDHAIPTKATSSEEL
jgi:hypothetical protein